jgi:ubiquinone/menaquinone biosynthesis C-methylase UbiE
MGIEKQGSKPTGILGKIIGRLMNKFHTSLYVDYFNEKSIPDNYRILDIGCGGGKILKYLSQKSKELKLWGLDHSKEMIDLTSRLNKEDIKQGRLKLLIGSVTKIAIEDNSLDIVTAFETVQFWPDLDMAFSEILRTLDKNGEFLIINRFPKEGTKWWKLASLKSEKDYRDKFESAGFRNITIDLNYKNGWIIVKGIK